jgi:hypothetical protein
MAMDPTDTFPGTVHHENFAFSIGNEQTIVGGLENILQLARRTFI